MEVEVPPFTLLKDERVRHEIQKNIEDNELGLSVSLLGQQALVRLIALSLSSATDDLIHIGGLILDRPADWVEENSSVSDLIDLVKTYVLTPVAETDEKRVKKGDVWTMGRLIDFMAQEYGWTVDDILSRTRWQLKAILDAAGERFEEQRKAMEESSSGRRRRGPRTPSGRPSAVREGRPKNISEEETQENIQALIAFAKPRGAYEKVERGSGHQ